MHKRPTAMLLPAPAFAKPDIVRRFLAFAQCAGPDAHGEAASALARASTPSADFDHPRLGPTPLEPRRPTRAKIPHHASNCRARSSRRSKTPRDVSRR